MATMRKPQTRLRRYSGRKWVDIAPFQTYREFRLCSGDEDMFRTMTGMLDSLISKILLEVALNGTEISESTDTHYQDIYFNILDDYLFTRLRHKIHFVDDHY